MIIKEKTLGPPSADPRLKAGDKAERDMAFYLRRGFEKPLGGGLLKKGFEVRVFNDLRLVLTEASGRPDGAGRQDAVQIDHLVMHPWGMVIVESKSVTEEVLVNEHGEWTRKYKGKRHGMPSPIEQARRQGEALRQLLRDNAGRLRDRKILGLVQGGFARCPIEFLVAISDKGIIDRRGFEATEVVKADQVVPRILEIIERHRKGTSLLSKTDAQESGMWSMTEGEAERITAFLLERHSPLEAEDPSALPEPPLVSPSPSQPRTIEAVAPASPVRAAAPHPNPAPVAAPIAAAMAAAAPSLEALKCDKCKSINVLIVHRKNYCLECDECGGFTRLDQTCTACGTKARIAKKGLEFRRECAGCGANRVFYRNVR